MPVGVRFPATRRILVVLLGAIGDVTRALPILPRLRAAYPEAQIAWAVEPPSFDLVNHHPWVEQTFLFRRSEGVAAFVSFLRKVRQFRADLCLDLQRHLKSGLVSRVSGAPVRLGFARANSREGNWLWLTHHIPPQEHLSSKLFQYQAFADYLGAPPRPIAFGLTLEPEEERRVAHLLRAVTGSFVAAFVGSSWPSRFWFPEQTASVIQKLAARGLHTVLVGGRNEQAFAEKVRKLVSAPVVDLTGQTSLRELVGIFARARAAWGPDSGPMHLAAAAGTRVISLWGATSPSRSAPWNNETGVILGQAPCMPCYRRNCPIDRLCMQNISVAQVVSAILQACQLDDQTREDRR